MTSVLKPGILVSAKTMIRGGVSYQRTDLATGATESSLTDSERSEVTRWETTRVITDVEEHDRAVKTRNTAMGMIRRSCAVTSFGLLCPVNGEPELDEAIAQAREATDGFNRDAKYTKISVYVLKGRMAETDEEATRAIANEVAGLLGEMEQGIRDLDVSVIRDAANRARAMNQMLAVEQEAKVNLAVTAARAAAREIVKRVVNGAEEGGAVIQSLDVGAIEKARFAFLEMEADATPEGAALPGVATQRFAELEHAVEVAGVVAEADPTALAEVEALEVAAEELLAEGAADWEVK